MLKYEVFTNFFQSLEQEDDVSNEIYELSEQFVCTPYGHKEDHVVNAVFFSILYFTSIQICYLQIYK